MYFKGSFLSFLLLNIATSINAVPVINFTDSVPNFSSVFVDIVNVPNSRATTLPPVESADTTRTSVYPLMTSMEPVNVTNMRNARSENVTANVTTVTNSDQEKAKSSAIQFPKDDETSFNVTYSVREIGPTDSRVSELMNSNISTMTESIMETSSTFTMIDLTSLTTQKPLPMVNSSDITSMASFSNSSSVVEMIRAGRSQSDEIEDEMNGNLTQTLAALTTLSSIINQTSVNDSLSTLV